MTRETFEAAYPEMKAARILGMGMIEWESRSMADKTKIIGFLSAERRMRLWEAQHQERSRWRALMVILRYLLTGHCGFFGCCYVAPYGFVPEAGCPVHDGDSRFSQWARKVRKGQERLPWRVVEP